MEQILRVGVAGVGDAGGQVVQAVPGLPGFELPAIADTRQDALRTHHEKYGTQSFTSVDEMCASDAVDVVYVATPNKFHVANALAAIAKRKHVIVVKPLALTLADSDVLITAAEK